MIFVALALAAAPAPADLLTSTFSAAHRDYQARLRDSFADQTVSESMLGRPFKFVHALNNGQRTGQPPGSAFYSYKDGVLSLVFSLEQKSSQVDAKAIRYDVALVSGSRTQTGSYLGANSFGAKTRVERIRLREDWLGMVERPIPEQDQFYAKRGLQGTARQTYEIDLPLPAAKARALASKAAIAIQGTVARLPTGKLADCEAIYYGATMDTPMEIYGSACQVGANVSRVAFVRTDTGEVIKEWVK